MQLSLFAGSFGPSKRGGGGSHEEGRGGGGGSTVGFSAVGGISNTPQPGRGPHGHKGNDFPSSAIRQTRTGVRVVVGDLRVKLQQKGADGDCSLRSALPINSMFEDVLAYAAGAIIIEGGAT